MKICHILWELNYGGIETMVVNISNQQSMAGNDVSLIVINRINQADLKKRLKPSVKLYEINRRIGSKSILPVAELNYLIWRNKPDVIHFHDVNISKYIFPALIKKQCTTLHTTWIESLSSFYPRNPNLFAISNEVREDILNHTGADSKVIINGIEVSRYKRHVAEKASRPFKIVQIGRVESAIKGQDIAVNAIKILSEKGLFPTLDIIGDGSDKNKIQSIIDSQGLSKLVKICGFRTPEYIHEHLADYDLLLQPSRIEGFGLTVAEGMAANVPVAVSDLPALIEVTDHGRCGLIFKAGSPSDCALAIEKAMTENMEPMASQGLDLVTRKYDVSATADAYLKAYKMLK